jgi:hypothetical protein
LEKRISKNVHILEIIHSWKETENKILKRIKTRKTKKNEHAGCYRAGPLRKFSDGMGCASVGNQRKRCQIGIAQIISVGLMRGVWAFKVVPVTHKFHWIFHLISAQCR